MKTIGLIGGMSWQSTELYYRLINQGVNDRLGGLHSAKLVIESVDFAEIEPLQREGNWAMAGSLLARAASRLETAGAELLLICANTMHIVAPQIEAAVDIPLIHLADATAARVRAAGMDTVGLLGTRYTMEQDFYSGRLAERHGLEVVVPGAGDRECVNRVIFEELCHGVESEQSRRDYLRVMARLVDEGAEGVILGCTEITKLVRQPHTDIPLFDTTAIHAEEAVRRALD